MTDKSFEPKKLTPTFLKSVFTNNFKLIVEHQRSIDLLYQMIASLAVHAPLARPAHMRVVPGHGCVIEQPTHWLVYHLKDRARARLHAEGALREPSLPPTPIGCVAPTGRRTKTGEPICVALHGRLLGEWPATRCVIAVCAGPD